MEKISFLEEVTGVHNGQVDFRLTAYFKENAVGCVHYSIYDNTPFISYIETKVEYRRQGVGHALLSYIQQNYLDKEINWGMLTEDGKKLKDAITYSVEDQEILKYLKELELMKSQKKVLEQNLDGLLDTEDMNAALHERINNLGDEWNALEDRIFELESKLYGKKPYKTFVLNWMEQTERSNEDMGIENGYRYYSINRPVSIGTYPKNGNLDRFENYESGLKYIDEINREAWGELIYNHPLTEKEIDNYELVQTEEQRKKVQTEQRKALFQSHANPRYAGNVEHQSFIQRYYETEDKKFMPEDIVFVGRAERSIAISNALNEGKMTVEQAMSEWKQKDIDLNEMPVVREDIISKIAFLDHINGIARRTRDSNLFYTLTEKYPFSESQEMAKIYLNQRDRANTTDTFVPKMAILQLREGEENRKRAFLDLNNLQSLLGEMPQPENYEIIFIETLESAVKESEIMQSLEQIYIRFNENAPRPSNYYGHSLSVGDIIVLAEDSMNMKTYFVDRVGYNELPDFMNRKLKDKIALNMDIEKEYQMYLDLLGFSIENRLYSLIKSNIERQIILSTQYLRIFELAKKRGVLEQTNKLNAIHEYEKLNGGENNVDAITVYNADIDRIFLKMDIVNDLTSEELHALVDNIYEQAVHEKKIRNMDEKENAGINSITVDIDASMAEVLKDGKEERGIEKMEREPMKDEYLAQEPKEMSARERLTEQLQKGIRSVLDSENFINYLRTCGRYYLNNYSFRNAMLVYLQKPQSTYVMGYEKWKEFGRQVKRNYSDERMDIKILAPVYAYEKQYGGLYRHIMEKLNEQLKNDPGLFMASYNIGQSRLALTLDRRGIVGLRSSGKEIKQFVEKNHSDVRQFIDKNIIGKVPMYYKIVSVFDVSDTFTPEYIWLKSGFLKEDKVLDEHGNAIKNKRGEYKIRNTEDRKAKFNPKLDFSIPESDTVKMELLYDVLQKISAKKGVPMTLVSNEQDEILSDGADGYYMRPDKEKEGGKGKIVISMELPITKRVAVAFHEMSHADLHCNTDKMEQQLGEHIDKNMREVQAEAAAYMTARNFGIDTDTSSFNYLAVWRQGRELPELEKSLDIIYQESKSLMLEIQKELESRGLTLQLESKEQAPFTKEEKDYILKTAYDFVLTETKENKGILDKLEEFLNKDIKENEKAAIIQQYSILEKCSGEINNINSLCDKLIKSEDRTEQMLLEQKINASITRCGQLKQELSTLSENLLGQMEQGQPSLKSEFEKNPRRTLDILKNDFIELQFLSEQELQYLSKSKFIADNYGKILNISPQKFTELAIGQLKRTQEAMSKKGTFIEIHLCEQHTPVFSDGTVIHPRIANKIIEEAEMKVRGLKADAKNKGEYYPYVKCNLTVFSPAEQGLSAYHTRIDIGDGEQKNLVEHLQQVLSSKGEEGQILDYIKSSLRERSSKGKMQVPPVNETIKEMDCNVEQEKDKLTLEDWKRQINIVREEHVVQDQNEKQNKKGNDQPDRD